MITDSLAEVCLVVIFYNPKDEQVSFFETLASKGFHIIVVDNSVQAIPLSGNLVYIPLFANMGIAHAQNKGVKEAIRRGFRYFVFFDQDSRFDEQYVSSIYHEYQKIQSNDPHIATLGPLLIDSKTGQEYLSSVPHSKMYDIDTHIISSGSIVEKATFDVVGLYEEDLFIDLVDSEWCWRAKTFGLNTYMTRRVKLYHSMGKRYWRFGRFAIRLSSPNRYYYQYRNMILMLRRDYAPFRWKYKTGLRSLLDLCMVPIISSEGKQILIHMIKGIRDGIKGV